MLQKPRRIPTFLRVFLELELKLNTNPMAQKPMLRADMYARALRASQDVKRAVV
jgi:hypothetical protein